MRLFEILTETAFKLTDHKGPRSVFFTKQFEKDLAKYKKYHTDISQDMQNFLDFKIENGNVPYNKKDGPYTHLSGVWHYHLIHGKVILFYSADQTHIELYFMIEHKDYDTPKGWTRIENYISRLSESDFTEFKKQKPVEKIFDLDEISGLIYSMIDNNEDRALLNEYLNSGKGDFILYVMDLMSISSESEMISFLKQWQDKFRSSFSDYIKSVMKKVQ